MNIVSHFYLSSLPYYSLFSVTITFPILSRRIDGHSTTAAVAATRAIYNFGPPQRLGKTERHLLTLRKLVLKSQGRGVEEEKEEGAEQEV